MTTTLSFKDDIDIPEWRPLGVAPNASAAGVSVCSDMRNSVDADPHVWQLVSAAILNRYSTKNDGWNSVIANPGLTGTFGAGAGCVVAPQRGPRGTVAAGATTTSVTLSTALPGSVGVNQLANRGDRMAYKVRLIDNGSGGSGKTAEVYVAANTSGTTPTLYFASALPFTMVAGGAYEFLSGRVYMLSAGTLAAGCWKAYDILTNTVLANLSTTNLPATLSTDSSLVVLDELYVPTANLPGQGMLQGSGTGGVGGVALTATATSSTTLTGQATGGDAGVLANEYRNFQIRIVQDTVNPTAAGQRRKITSHTAGASPVYTVLAWTVTPSSSAQYVIEYSNEVLLWTSGQTNTYTYTSDVIGGSTADSWSTTTYAVRANAHAAGCVSFLSFAGPAETASGARLNRFSFIHSFRGGGSALIDLFDIAGGTTGLWTSGYVDGGSGPLFSTGTSLAYDSNSGFAYVNQSAAQTMFRYDGNNNVIEEWAQIRYAQGAAVVGNRMAQRVFVDGATKVGLIFMQRSSGLECFNILAQR